MPKPPILYAEDDKNDVLFMELAFKAAALPYALKIAANGEEALQYLKGTERFANRSEFPFPCMVILDLNMPYKSGFDVLKWIRQQPELASLPVIVFSSSVQGSDLERAHQLGSNQYVEKPANPLKLGALLKELERRWLGKMAKSE